MNRGRGGRGRVEEGVNSSMIYLIHCKNLCKCHNEPPPSTIKEKRKGKNTEESLQLSKYFKKNRL
jgi:hypothetical protein